jgi:hypothetical protein
MTDDLPMVHPVDDAAERMQRVVSSLPASRAPTARQLLLLDAGLQEQSLEQSEHARGVFTGDRLAAREPKRYAVVCRLIAEGVLSQRQIASVTGTSRNLVAVIVRERQADIEPLRKRLAGDFFAVSKLCTERAMEILTDPSADIPLSQLAIMAGVSFDKGQLASGGPTSITGDAGAQPGSSSTEEYMVLLRRRRPAMGLEGEKNGAKGEVGAGAGAQAECTVGGDVVEQAKVVEVQVGPAEGVST